MTLLEFGQLPENRQISILYNRGIYIGKRKKEHLSALLYQVDSFYVEVVYEKYRSLIAFIDCTESTDILDPYLEQIPVAHLV